MEADAIPDRQLASRSPIRFNEAVLRRRPSPYKTERLRWQTEIRPETYLGAAQLL